MNSNSSSIPKPQLIFSYQGAFGPPTYGHYKAMDAFAEKINEKYNEDYNIQMLFMPTAKSGSKKHLEPTQISRINILNLFCKKLKIKYPNIDFEASKTEYELNPIQKGNTSTIHTIQKIANNSNINIPTNKPNKLILGMGMDNMFQLPYWKNVEDFHKKVSEIYIVPRKLTQSEEDNTHEFIINDEGEKHRFEKILPWNIKKEIINKRFGIETYSKNDSNEHYNKGTNIAELSKIIKMKLPNIIVIDKIIPSTSSSMLRHYLSLYNEPNKDEIRRNINKIIFGKNCTNDDMVIDELIKEYGELFSGTLSKPYKNYNTEFKEYKTNLTNNLNNNSSNKSNNHVNTITAKLITAKLKQDGGKKIRKSKTSKKNKTSKKSKKGMKK